MAGLGSGKYSYPLFVVLSQRNIHGCVFWHFVVLPFLNSQFNSAFKSNEQTLEEQRNWNVLFCFRHLPVLDLHPHAASLFGHATAKSGDPSVPGDPAPPGEKSSRHQQSCWWILHPKAWFLHLVPQAQQVRSGLRRGQGSYCTVGACACVNCTWVYILVSMYVYLLKCVYSTPY